MFFTDTFFEADLFSSSRLSESENYIREPQFLWCLVCLPQSVGALPTRRISLRWLFGLPYVFQPVSNLSTCHSILSWSVCLSRLFRKSVLFCILRLSSLIKCYCFYNSARKWSVRILTCYVDQWISVLLQAVSDLSISYPSLCLTINFALTFQYVSALSAGPSLFLLIYCY